MEKIKYYYSKPISEEIVVSFSGNYYLKRRSKKRFPRMTICSILDTEKNTLSFGCTVCSTKDIFTKKEGRQYAYINAIEKPIKVINLSEGDFIRGISFDFVSGIFLDFYNKVI